MWCCTGLLNRLCSTVRLTLYGFLLIPVFQLHGCSGGHHDAPSSSSGDGGAQASAQPGRFNGQVLAIVPVRDSSGDVYVAGAFTTYNDQPVRPVVRLRPNGTLNETFRLADAVPTPTSDNRLTAIAVADDGTGDLYVSEVFPPQDRGRVWKVTASGGLDSSFAIGVARFLDQPTFDTPTELFAITPVGDGTGRVYVGGLFDQYDGHSVRHLVRLNPDGTIDPTFTASITRGATGVRAILPAKDGTRDVLIIDYGLSDAPGSYSSQQIMRLKADGTLLSSAGVLDTFGHVCCFALVDDGSGDLFVSGSFRVFNGTGPLDGFARIDRTGALNTTSPQPRPVGPSGLLQKTADGTADWLIVSQSVLRRYKADGTVEPGFRAGQIAGQVGEGVFITITPAPDNRTDLYVGGAFTTYNGASTGNIVRLNADGTLDGR
jgi:beta-propeller uncharacterized protein DUF5122